jgi:hypothetical protein
MSGGASIVPSGPRASVGGGVIWSWPSWTWSIVELISFLLVWVAPYVDRSCGSSPAGQCAGITACLGLAGRWCGSTVAR